LWILIPLGVVFGLVILMAAIGAALREDHVASRRARLTCSADDAWKTIADFSTWPAWNDFTTGMVQGEDRGGRPVWVMISRQGRMPCEVTTFEPPRRMVTTIVGDKLPFGGSWTYEVAPADGGGCTVTVTERGEIYNPLFRFLSRFLFGYHRSLDGFLRSLGRKFGQDVTPVDAAP
jgi:hypothetical protein